MKLQYGIYVLAVFFSLALASNSAHADTLDPETVKSLVNGFNPVVGPIPTKSYLPPSGCAIPQPGDSQGAINKIQCGLYASDPLNNETKTRSELEAEKDYWTYGGSATGFNPPAPLDFFKDVDGLHIGVQAPSEGTYAGYYAVSPNTNGMLFHSQITSPLRTTPSGYYQNGIYVQTAQDPINYVACVSITNNIATLWAVVHTYSSPFQALVFDTLYVDTSANQPLTRDCTIVTNGSNYLEVYLDNSLVYSSDALALAMPAPFNFFLEPQSSYPGQMLYGVYRDYYATSDKNIRIENIPQNATSVKIVDGSGNILSSIPPVLGTARLDVAKYHYPLDAYIKAYDSSGALLAATPVSQTIYGGDLYSTVYPSSTDVTRQKIDSTIDGATKLVIATVNDATQRLNDAIDSATRTAISTINTANQTAISTINTANQTAATTVGTAGGQLVHLSVTSADVNGKEFEGMWTELWRNGILVQQGYTPFSTYVQAGAQYEVFMGNWNNITFDHWEDGSTNPMRPFTTTQDTTFTAFFRIT